MKKLISFILIAVMAASLVACSTNTKDNTNQESVEASPFKKLYDYINENGAEMTGHNALMAAVEDSYISIIAKSESTVELMLLSETEELATKVSIVITEGEPEHKVTLISKVDGIPATYEGYIAAKTYNPDEPEILSYKSASPESMWAEEQKALSAAVNYTLVIADTVMEKAPVSLKDLGFANVSAQ